MIVDLTAGSELICRFNSPTGVVTLPVFVKLSNAYTVPFIPGVSEYVIDLEFALMGDPLEAE